MEQRFPSQMKSYKSKDKNWRKNCVDWADSKATFNHSLVRKSVRHKIINYDLVNGKLHMEDLQTIINPNNQELQLLEIEQLQHYPIMNSKLNVLKGEEGTRVFDWRVVVTNPTAISAIEDNKKAEATNRIQQIIESDAQSEDEIQAKLQKVEQFLTYEWQDMREVRANQLLNHYIKEQNLPEMFNNGMMDAMVVGEEVYQCSIEGGEPVVRRLNPLKVRMIKSGFSNKFEDADMIILEDYWNPGRIIDTYYDVLTKKDIKYLDELPNNLGNASTDSMDNIDPRDGFINASMFQDVYMGDDFYFDPAQLFDASLETSSSCPYDMYGNIRVLQVFWKSKRMIKRIKSYDPQTSEEIYQFKTEDYFTKKDMGEEEKTFWINEAWEGVKIGKDIYVNMRPRVVQYNRLSNPSRCHFGIIGSIYNMNDDKPYSLVDMMKPYSYLYDVIHARLTDAIANNWGAIMDMDLAQVPDKWSPEKWMYFAKVNHVRVRDSFKEGNKGAATGKLAAALNSNSQMGLALDQGNYIQQLMNILEWIKNVLGEIAGISRQREGQISNRETVGGVERATLQSSHITEWIFIRHDDIKRRVFECLLETAKVAYKGKSPKFQYITSDGTQQLFEINGDEFAENDYGLVVSNDNAVQQLKQQIEQLAQAALQNQALSFSTIMKLFTTASLAEKQRFVENDERRLQEQHQQELQMQQQAQQEATQAQMQMAQSEQQLKDSMNQRDNETKIIVAQIAAQNAGTDAELDGISTPMTENERAQLSEKMREFDKTFQLNEKKHQLEKDRLKFDQKKADVDAQLKRKQIAKQGRVIR